jgi:hypothetical protein
MDKAGDMGDMTFCMANYVKEAMQVSWFISDYKKNNAVLFAVYVDTVEVAHLENMPVILWKTRGDTRVNAARRPLTVRGQECITGNYRLRSKCGCSVCMTVQTI